MKVTLIKSVSTDIEISLPAYVKFGDLYTKIADKKYCIRVQNWEYGCTGIEICPLTQNNPFANDGWEFISEDQFNSVYEEVLKKVTTFQPDLNLQPA